MRFAAVFMRLRFLKLDREFFCLQPSIARLYSAAASPAERLRSDGSLAIMVTKGSRVASINLSLSQWQLG